MNAAPLRVLVLGCGNIAGGFDMARQPQDWPLTHAGAFRRHGGFELAACIDPDAERRSAFAHHWGIPRQADSLARLAAAPGTFDVISICSPTALHHEHLQGALALAPRLIFCEKPLTHGVASSAQWVQACEASGVPLVVNYTRQWDPALQRLAGELLAGRWGAVRAAAGFYNKGVVNNGGHLIDLLLRLLGPLDVVAATAARHDFWPDDPTVAALLRSRRGGVPVSLNPAHAADFAYFELELVCELGVVRMCDGGLHWQQRRAAPSEHFKGYRTLAAAETSAGDYFQAMTLAVTEIHDHLTLGQPVRSTGASALAVQALCAELLQAAQAPVPTTL